MVGITEEKVLETLFPLWSLKKRNLRTTRIKTDAKSLKKNEPNLY